MHSFIIRKIFFSTFLFLILSCQETTVRQIDAEVKGDPFWNDAARYFAGLPVTQESSFYKATQDAGYDKHVTQMNEFWNTINQSQNTGIQQFQQTYLKETPETVVYPLSGADFLNLYQLFPDCKTYIMIATEKPGGVGNPDQFKSHDRIASLGAIRSVISSIAIYNYLYTVYMMKWMNGYYVYGGTMPVVLMLMARMGHTPLKAEDISLDENGKIISGSKGSIKGYKITFLANNKVRELIYLAFTLSNESVNPATATGKFLTGYTNTGLFLKAAVYMLHRPHNEEVRNYFLKHSSLIVQDDSGMPYRYLTDYDVQLFGSYIKPFRIGGNVGYHPQEELAKAYAEKSIPIEFNFGYGALTGKNKSNLILARKRKSM